VSKQTSTAEDQVLEVRNISKQFFGSLAVNDVSFHVKAGEVTGYLGPNGSGKSTTMKIIAGLIEPSAGEILFGGELVRRDLIAWKRRLGYVPEEPHLYVHLSGLEYLTMVGDLRGLPHGVMTRRIDGLLQLLSLTPSRHMAIASYSKGMRQKVLLAAALLHNPEILLLDEPFAGLDVSSALVVRGLVQELARRGKVVLFSSHEL
jgi:ABC-2 type transport system ATP-binding protein